MYFFKELAIIGFWLTKPEQQSLEGLLDRFIESALSAGDAIDQALLLVEASNLRIETMEKGSKQ